MTFIMLMTMSKIHALLQKVLEDWLRLPERQELFAGLLDVTTLNELFNKDSSNDVELCYFGLYTLLLAGKFGYESPCKCEGVKEMVSEQEVGQKVQDTLNNINNNVFKSIYFF